MLAGLRDTTYIYTQERSPSLGMALDRRALCFATSGAQWRKSTQEISLAREHGDMSLHGDISLHTDSLASFPGYVLCRDVEASHHWSWMAWASRRPRAVRLILITVILTSLSWHCPHGRGKLC